MLSQEGVLGLIGRIYDAAADERRWPAFLEDFANAADGTVTGLIHYDLEQPRANSVVFARMASEFARGYVDYYSTVNPWIRSYRAKVDIDGPDSITTSEELVDLTELEKTEYYNDFLRPQDTIHQFAGMIVKRGVWGSAFACHRPRMKGPFDRQEIKLLRALFPHLQRALQFHRKFAELEGHQRASLDALDRLPVGVILLDDAGCIVAANSEAYRIFGQNDGLSVRKNEVAATRPDESRALRALMVGSARTANGQGFGAGGTLAISRPSGKRPFALLVTPVARHAFAPDIRTPAVIVFVTDPEQRPESLPSILTRIYRLTAAESRLAEILMQGETLVRAADRLGISHNTARTHLQRIYEKTDTKHQGQLVRLLVGNAYLLGDKFSGASPPPLQKP